LKLLEGVRARHRSGHTPLDGALTGRGPTA
jgi:hypothetical protein